MSNDTLLVHPGVFRYLMEDYRGNLHHFDDYKVFRSLIPDGLDMVSIEHGFEDASMDYGIRDLYVLEDSDGTEWGKRMYRAVGKHADYDEVYEEWPTGRDMEGNIRFEPEWIPFKRLGTRTVEQYYFPSDN